MRLLLNVTATRAIERTEYSEDSGRTNLAWLLNQALSHVHSMCHLSRGALKTEGISLHKGRTKVPGNMPISFGRSPSFMPLVLVLKDGCTWLGGRKFICLPRHCWEVSEKARHCTKEPEGTIRADVPTGIRRVDAIANRVD